MFSILYIFFYYCREIPKKQLSLRILPIPNCLKPLMYFSCVCCNCICVITFRLLALIIIITLSDFKNVTSFLDDSLPEIPEETWRSPGRRCLRSDEVGPDDFSRMLGTSPLASHTPEEPVGKTPHFRGTTINNKYIVECPRRLKGSLWANI